MTDEIQVQMSTAREFMFAVRLRNESDEQSFANLNRIEKSINEQGFDCTRAEKDDVKRILSRYFGIITDEKQLDDNDGDSTMQKWIIPDCELPQPGEGVAKGHESVIIVIKNKNIIKLKLCVLYI